MRDKKRERERRRERERKREREIEIWQGGFDIIELETGLVGGV